MSEDKISGNFSGNWRDYFVVPDSYGADKLLLEKVLDDIVATGQDGKDLLMKAYLSASANRSIRQAISSNIKNETGIQLPTTNQKVEFSSDGGLSGLLGIDKGSHVEQLLPGVIQIDPTQIRRIAWKDNNDALQRASLTGVVVHELYHQADPNFRIDVQTSPQKRREAIDFLVESETLTYEQKSEVFRAYTGIVDDLIKSHVNKNTPIENMGEQMQLAIQKAGEYVLYNQEEILASIEQATGIPKTSYVFKLFSDPDAVMAQAIERNDKIERDATNYTDAFMKKHFPKEPWRGEYSNAHLLEPLASPIIQIKGCGEVRLDKYSPEEISSGELGKLVQPVISQDQSPFCNRTR